MSLKDFQLLSKLGKFLLIIFRRRCLFNCS